MFKTCRLITLLLVLFCLSMVCEAQRKNVTIEIKCIEPYCGGARPTPEMEEESQKPKPYSNKMVILISKTGKVDSLSTNKDGKLKKKLPFGSYDLFEAWRYYKSTPGGESLNSYDKDCLETDWKKSFMELIITKRTITQKAEDFIRIPCQGNMPCILEKHLPPQRQ